ncbi:MAG: diguanylate cyclase [Candidatus Coatesbacteria bacterium]|mgnify:CR=1 FL=1
MPQDADSPAGGERLGLLLLLAGAGLAVAIAGAGAYVAAGSSLATLERTAFVADRVVNRQLLRARESLNDYLSTGRPDLLRNHRRASAALKDALVVLREAGRSLDGSATPTQDSVDALTSSIRNWESGYARVAIAHRLKDTSRDLAQLNGMRERGEGLDAVHAIGRRLDTVQQRFDDALDDLRTRTASRRQIALVAILAGLVLWLAATVVFVWRYAGYQSFLRRRSARLEALADYADRMHGLANADQAAKALTAAVGGNTHRSTVLFRIPGTIGMRIAAFTGELAVDAANSPVLADRGACPVMRTGHRFLIRNPATEVPCDCAACASRHGGYVCIPLLAQGGTAGLINWQAGRDRAPHPSDLNRIEELARVTSLALTNLFSLEGAMHDAVTDQLTGVANRRFLDGYLSKQFQTSMRQGRALGLLMLDLDRFKVFNDTNGHLAGDAVLRAAARTAVAAVRDGDLVARYGGEEFAVILPDAERTATLEIAERIRSGIEAMRVDGLPSLRPPVITVSIGAAVAPVDGRTVQAAMHAADDALYAAKEAGRNRIETARKPAGS